MKAISLFQPWATLVAVGAKKLETRSWRTWYHGPLAIHASKAMPSWARQLCTQEPFLTALRDAGYPFWQDLPLGAVLATVTLDGCCETGAAFRPEEPERSFGDFSPVRWAWVLKDVQRLPDPIPAKGSMGLWEWNR